MTIAAFERHRRAPTADEVRAERPMHPRCGTAFIALVVITSGIVFSFVARDPIWFGAIVRVALLPVVAAIAYEMMRAAAGARGALWARAISWPGLALQRITTRRPDGAQIEVAIAALAGAIRP